jgi:hypothetical protein
MDGWIERGRERERERESKSEREIARRGAAPVFCLSDAAVLWWY